MLPLSIYIHTRDKQNDFYWITIPGSQEQIPLEKITKLYKLIADNGGKKRVPIALELKNNYGIFLIGNLSSAREDHVNRPIKNALAVVFSSKDREFYKQLYISLINEDKDIIHFFEEYTEETLNEKSLLPITVTPSPNQSTDITFNLQPIAIDTEESRKALIGKLNTTDKSNLFSACLNLVSEEKIRKANNSLKIKNFYILTNTKNPISTNNKTKSGIKVITIGIILVASILAMILIYYSFFNATSGNASKTTPHSGELQHNQ